MEALRSPRWEDYEYEYHEDGNRGPLNQMGWLGNGWGIRQLDDKPDRTALSFYITPMFQERDIGVPQYPRPEDNEQFNLRPWSH